MVKRLNYGAENMHADFGDRAVNIVKLHIIFQPCCRVVLFIGIKLAAKTSAVTSVNLKKAGMASRNIFIKNNIRCFKSALQ